MNINRHLLLVIILVASHAMFSGAHGTTRTATGNSFRIKSVEFNPAPQTVRFEDKLIVRRIAGVELHSPVPYIVFSPDGQHVAYLAKIADNQPDAGRVVIVVDDQMSEAFDSRFGPIRFSEDSQKVAYTITRDRRTKIIVGKKPVAELNGKVLSVAFSSNLDHYAYVVSEGNKNIAVVDGKVITGDFESVREIALSPDGKRYLAVARNNLGREYVVSDGVKLGKEYGRITQLNFSPNGKSIAYSAEDNGQSFVVLDSRVVEVESGFGLNPAWSLIYSDDSTRLMYSAWNTGSTKGFVGVVDKLYHWKYGEAFGPAHALAMSPDNQYLFQVSTNRSRVLINGVLQPIQEGFSITDPAFSPSGKLVAFTARGGGKQHVVVMRLEADFLIGGRSNTFDYVSKPVFNADGTKVAFGVLQGTEFWWRTLAVR